MKKILLILALIFINKAGFSQWTTTGNNIANSNTGNVGIGTGSTAPVSTLDIGGGVQISGPASTTPGNGLVYGLFHYSGVGLGIYSAATGASQGIGIWTNYNAIPKEVIRILSGGNVLIGTTAPTSASSYKMELYGSDPLFGLSGSINGIGQVVGIEFNQQTTSTATRQGGAIKSIATGTYTWGTGISYAADLAFYTGFNNANTERMRITSTGNLLVGKTSQTNTAYKIDVNGSIRSNSIVINTTGADFVFAPAYKLPSLATVDYYIKLNHHLPGIAPANEMQANGLNLGDNQTKLLQKTEELTLYLIEKDKQLKAEKSKIAEQENKLNDQQEEINLMKQQMEAIEKQLNKKK